MRQEVEHEWVLSVCNYLQIDPDTTKAVLVDFYGVYVQSYLFDDDGLMLFNGDQPRIFMYSIPVNRPDLVFTEDPD